MKNELKAHLVAAAAAALGLTGCGGEPEAEQIVTEPPAQTATSGEAQDEASSPSPAPPATVEDSEADEMREASDDPAPEPEPAADQPASDRNVRRPAPAQARRRRRPSSGRAAGQGRATPGPEVSCASCGGSCGGEPGDEE